MLPRRLPRFERLWLLNFLKSCGTPTLLIPFLDICSGMLGAKQRLSIVAGRFEAIAAL